MYAKCTLYVMMQKYIGQMLPAFLISEGGYPHLWMVAFLDGIGITLKCTSLFILSKYMRVSKTTP